MKRPEYDDADWVQCNRVVDGIADLVTREAARPDVDAIQILAGLLLALLSYVASSPPQHRPASLQVAIDQVSDLLSELVDYKAWKKRRDNG